jgi:hypothetical protein
LAVQRGSRLPWVVGLLTGGVVAAGGGTSVGTAGLLWAVVRAGCWYREAAEGPDRCWDGLGVCEGAERWTGGEGVAGRACVAGAVIR